LVSPILFRSWKIRDMPVADTTVDIFSYSSCPTALRYESPSSLVSPILFRSWKIRDMPVADTTVGIFSYSSSYLGEKYRLAHMFFSQQHMAMLDGAEPHSSLIPE